MPDESKFNNTAIRPSENSCTWKHRVHEVQLSIIDDLLWGESAFHCIIYKYTWIYTPTPVNNDDS